MEIKEDAMEKPAVLFVCIHNSARSQMAEAYLKSMCGGKLTVESAGLEPGELNPLAIQVMKEDGIDISGNRTKSVFDLFTEGRLYRYVITLCDQASAEACPLFPGQGRRIHWSFEDPASFLGTNEERIEKTREVRDRIKTELTRFCAQLETE
jgi:arsenate reductase